MSRRGRTGCSRATSRCCARRRAGGTGRGRSRARARAASATADQGRSTRSARHLPAAGLGDCDSRQHGRRDEPFPRHRDALVGLPGALVSRANRATGNPFGIAEALVGLAGGFALSLFGVSAYDAARRLPATSVTTGATVVSLVGLWIGFVGACVLAARAGARRGA